LAGREIPVHQKFLDIDMGGKPEEASGTISNDDNTEKLGARTKIDNVKVGRKTPQKPLVKQWQVGDNQSIINIDRNKEDKRGAIGQHRNRRIRGSRS
jgi:hypothetical protein